MSLLGWTFLFGALAVGGPIAAHLLAKPRYRRVPFTMLRFLRSGQSQSQSRRRLRDLMVLLFRCAIIVLLAVLFARPVLMRDIDSMSARQVHFLGLDNSMSMAYADSSGRYLDSLIDAASEYIRSAPDDALFNLCFLASGDWIRDLSGAAALARLRGMDVVAGSVGIGDFLTDLNAAIRTAGEKSKISVFVASDFTPDALSKFLNVQEPVTVNRLEHRLIVTAEPIDNVAIVAAQTADISEAELTINATLVNYGEGIQQRELIVSVDGTEATSVNVELAGYERRMHQSRIAVEAIGDKQCAAIELSLSPADSLEADDAYRVGIVVPQRRTTSVVLVERHTDDLFLFGTALEALSNVGSHSEYTIRRVLQQDLEGADLSRADVVVFSGMAGELQSMLPALAMFVEDGGRLIFFMTGEPDAACVRLLAQKGLLPAIPSTLVEERTYLEPRPEDRYAQDVDSAGALALSNYRIDKYSVEGYWRCEEVSGGVCLWRCCNGAGHTYLKRIGSGVSILVNTSTDGSRGPLMKSGALVALCQYLLGEGQHVREIVFASDQRIVLPLGNRDSAEVGQSRILVRDCGGKRRLARRVGSVLTVPDAGGTGWVATVGEPAVFAGVNLPEGETDMSTPSETDIEDAMNRVFSVVGGRDVVVAGQMQPKRPWPLWKVLAWVIIAMLLVESTVANRLKR